MPIQETGATFFHLSHSHDSYNSPLTSSLISQLGPNIKTSPFGGARARSGDLLIDRTEPANLGFLMESSALLMGMHHSDLEMLIYRATTSSLPLEALYTVIPFIEFRDDRRVTDAGPLARWYADKIVSADKEHKIVGATLWDSHSDLAVSLLQEAFYEKGQDIAITKLTSARLFARMFQQNALNRGITNIAIVSLDLGQLPRSMIAAREINAPVILFDKNRPKIEDVSFGIPFIAHPESGYAVPVKPEDLHNLVVLNLDDLSGTARSICDSAAILKSFGVAEVHAAITHGTFIQPEARKRLGAAMEIGDLHSIMLTDSMPKTMNGDTQEISIAPATAALMRYVANCHTEEDIPVIEDVLLPPSPPKAELKDLLYSERLSLRPEEWMTIQQQHVVYQYTGN